MGKFLLSTLLLLTTAFASTAETVTFTLKDYCTNAQTITSKTIEDITLSFAKGTNTNNAPTYYDSGDAGRMYAGNTFTVTWQDGVNIESIKYTWVKKGSKWGTSSPTTVESVNLPTSGNSVTVSVDSKDNGVRDLTVTYTLSSGPTYPTECAAPVLKINGTATAETEVMAYAGTIISISCATPNAATIWTVNEKEIDGAEYTIPTTAKAGDVYSFSAQSHVQGESSVINSKTTDLKVTIAETPLEGYFYTAGNAPTDYKAAFATEFTNASTNATNTSGGLNNKSFTSNLASIEFTSETATSGTKYYPFVNGNGELKLYKNNALYISVPSQYTITSIYVSNSITNLALDIDNSLYNKDTQTNTFTFSGNVSKIKVTNTGNSMTFCKTLTVIYKIAELALPEIHEDCQNMLTEGAITKEGNLKFAEVAEGIDLWYKLEQNQNANALAEVNAIHEHGAEGYTKYDPTTGIDITKNHVGHTLTAFACDAANGIDSEPVSYAVTISTGVAEIEAAGAGEVRWFDMQGREVKGQPEKGIYVRVVNGKASKVIL